jgi:hypothetical protein
MNISLRARVAIFAALALLVFGAAGVALAVQASSPRSTPPRAEPTPRASVEADAPSPIPALPHVMSGYDVEGMTLTEVDGYLIVIDERCYGLQTDEGALLAVFPAGSYATAEGIEIAGAGESRPGYQIVGFAALIPPPRDFEPPAPECATDRVVVLDYVRPNY